MYSHLKNVVLGRVCNYGHDHGGGSYRHKNNATCVQCQRERISRWHASPRGRDAHKESKLRNRKKLIAGAKKYRRKNKDKLMSYNAEYREKNREWYLSYYRSYNNARRCMKLKATPHWADINKIESIYREAMAKGLEVDHIVPLKSNIVCGLHVEANLQLLTRSENIRKGNRIWPHMPQTS